MRALTILAVAVALALGAASCGEEDGDSGTGTTTAAQERSGAASGADDAGGGEGSAQGDSARDRGGSGGDDDAVDFTPEPHDDSGGGSQQLRVEGGDNSVQEFGAEADEADFEQAAEALHNFLDARAQGAWAAACSYLSREITASLAKLAGLAGRGGGSCAAQMKKLTNPAAKDLIREEAEKADVGSLRVEGDRAFVVYRGLDDTIMAMPMAEEDGAWKVASLAGTPLN